MTNPPAFPDDPSATPPLPGTASLTITITIDGVEHTVTDDDQDAAALLRLVDRDPKTYDLFVIDDNGIEEHVKDEQIVDLADGARFRARRRVHFTIDGGDHASWDDDQSAADLLRLAGVDPTGYDLALVTTAGSPTTFTAEQVLTIKEGDEFVTAKRVGGVA